jgi:hypothetical protein
VGNGLASVSAPFRREGTTVAVQLPSDLRDVLARSFSLVSELIAGGREEAWRVSPPLYDDPLLEAEAALAGHGEHASPMQAASNLLEQWSRAIATVRILNTEDVDALARVLTFCRLVLAETRATGHEQGLVDLLGALLEALLEVAPDPDGFNDAGQ